MAIIDASTLLLAGHTADDRISPRLFRGALPELQGKYGLAAPNLLVWELGHVVHKKLPRRFGRSCVERMTALETLLQDILLIAPSGDSIKRTGLIAEERSLSFYDAAYLELAESRPGSILLTEDSGLRAAGEALLGKGRAFSAASAVAALATGEI